MKIKAHAKINLFLEIVGKRENGYHDLEVVSVPINLFDSIHLSVSDQNEMSCDKHYIPVDSKNSMAKAVALMQAKYPQIPNQKIHLVKNVPSMAGLGGGSADAAAIIQILNKEYSLQMSRQELIDIAISVGSDVPYCLFNQPSIINGMGEILTPFKRELDFYIFLVKPSFGVSTKAMFDAFEFKEEPFKKANQVVIALEKNDYPLLIKSMFNRLQEVAISVFPRIQEIIHDLEGFGFDKVMMSGSGSVVYGITKNEDLCDRALSHYVKRYPFVKKARILR